MKKAARRRRNQDIAEHYDFNGAERGKYAKRYAAGVKVHVMKEKARSRPISIACNRMSKTAKAVNCRLTKDQALKLADALRKKADSISDDEKGQVHLANIGESSRTIIVGLQD